MTLNDLIPGKHIVKLEDGTFLIVLCTSSGEVFFANKECFMTTIFIDNDMNNKLSSSSNIVEVFEIIVPDTTESYKNNYYGQAKSIWKRCEPIEVTKDDVFMILKEKYGRDVKIVE